MIDFGLDLPEEKPSIFEEDPLAILLACYPYHNNSSRAFENLMNYIVNINELENRVIVTEENRKNAHTIARYYRNRIFKRILSNQHTSNYRKDLYNLLSKQEDRRRLKSDEIRALYRLPYFYYEDLCYDNLEKKYPLNTNQVLDEISYDKMPLTCFDSSIRFSKSVKQKFFWFNDHNDKLIKVIIDLSNPLIHLFEKELSKNENILKITGVACRTKVIERDIEVYQLYDWIIDDE